MSSQRRRRGRPNTAKAVLRRSHTRKRSYSTWARAYWALISIKRAARIQNYQGQAYWGQVYECTATDTVGVTGPRHFHVGRPSQQKRMT